MKSLTKHVRALTCATFALLAVSSCSPGTADGGDGDGPRGSGASDGTGDGDSCASAICLTTGGSTGAGGASSGGSGAGGLLGSGGAGSGGTLSSGGNPGAGGTSNGELPFLIGADITHTVQDEYWGATYTDDGVEKPLVEILKDHGFNAVRIDTFVDPSAPGGYAENEPEPFRNLAQTITLAQRVKAQGMYFLLDLHMSDTWTNPGAQATPNAWSNLSFTDLEEAVYDYVYDAVTQLENANALPDMVQIGNEITNGTLWESGRISNDDFSGLAALLEAGISAVRAVDPNILVMLHIEKCNNLATTRWWLDGILDEGVEFDVLGQSCYGATSHHAGYQGAPSDWTTVFNTIAAEYPDLKFVIAEYSSQQRAANDVVFNLPDNRGLGTFNWDPTRFYETHPNLPLFETDGEWNDFVVVEEQMAIYDQMAADYAAAGRF